MPTQEEDGTPEAPPQIDAAPLSRWERLGASTAGVLTCGAGVLAVFRSENQAGTVALILAGVLFLLMGVNGAPLIRARYQDYEVLMARRRREVVGNIEREPVESAVVALETLRTVDPQAARDPAVLHASAALYGRQVFTRLKQIEPAAIYTDGPGDMGRDAVLQAPGGQIAISIRGGSKSLSYTDLLAAARIPDDLADAILVVTSRALPPQIDRRLRDLREVDPRPLEIVRWVDSQDDEILREKVESLKSRIAN
ncbi:hypothetical protein [Streptomyces sp. NPDC048663]|uniref:hypothetical protein n=1 Tax=Streptomyces sp. NPDC048663 TaxID=3155638 RepID=UPI00342CF14A